MSRRPAVVVDVRAPRGSGAYAALVRRAARVALRDLEAAPCELSIALVDDGEMRALNRDWRGKDRPTDVLAFAQREGEVAPALDGAPPLLGDVVVSTATAARQARRRGHALEREIETLVVHGILHLLGYDHERSPAEARRMFRRQRELVALLPADRPSTSAAAAARPRTRGHVRVPGRLRGRSQ